MFEKMEVELSVFYTKKEKLKCKKCNTAIKKGERFVAEDENKLGSCFTCSPFVSYTFLPSGDVAMTRRSKKHSAMCGVLLEWNQRRKRFERRGQFVEAIAIAKAKKECEEDKTKREEKNRKAAIVRVEQDKIYIHDFSIAIKERYPNCPQDRQNEIALHACEKYSGRVGRTAKAKDFDADMIDLAVEAHIRHAETNYDNMFGKGSTKKEIRASIKGKIERIKMSWK